MEVDEHSGARQTRYLYRNDRRKLWWCALPYVDERGRKKQIRKSFRDRNFGSSKQAFHAALLWRDANLARLGETALNSSFLKVRRTTVEQLAALPAEADTFGLVGITVTTRDQPPGINVSVTAFRGQKKWFSMRRYGPFGAFRNAVYQRCQWVQAPMLDDAELHARFQCWVKNNVRLLNKYDIRL